jgi:peroxiredoxin
VKIHALLQKRGVGLAAISVDERSDSEALARSLLIGYPLLRDDGLRIATAYGVAMQGRDIAIPAVFVVLPSGVIFWKKVGESMLERPRTGQILEEVDRARAR